jgi:hypothetical protein
MHRKAVRTFVNGKTRIVKSHLSPAGVEKAQELINKLKAVDPKLTSIDALRNAVVAAANANTNLMTSVRLIGIPGLASLLGMIGIKDNSSNTPKKELSDKEKKDLEIDVKLAAQEEKCKSLYADHESYEKCLLEYVSLLKTKSEYQMSMEPVFEEKNKEAMLKFVKARDSFFSQMMQFSYHMRAGDFDNEVQLRKMMSEKDDAIKDIVIDYLKLEKEFQDSQASSTSSNSSPEQVIKKTEVKK